MSHQQFDDEPTLDQQADSPQDITDKLPRHQRFLAWSYPTTGTNETPTREASNDNHAADTQGVPTEPVLERESSTTLHRSAGTGPWR